VLTAGTLGLISVATSWPGAARLYAIPESRLTGDRTDGTVQAGRVYYATISVRYVGVAFRALNPRSRDNRWALRSWTPSMATALGRRRTSP
jgi:hypothetical protein